MIFATAHFRFAGDFDLDLEVDLDLAAFGAAEPGLPDLLRLPSTERPPPSIIAA
jgi:hypothetical protein